MIEYGNEAHIDELLQLCLQTHPEKDKAFFEYYFKNLFDSGKSFMIKEDERLISCMQMQEHKLHFADKNLLCSYIFGVASHVDYRRQGYMDKLMKHTLDMCSQNYLLTFIEAYNPKVYKKYGFETISYRKKFSIRYSDLKVKSMSDVSDDFEIEELVSLYKEFSKRFDCYYLRDYEYYKTYCEMIYKNGGMIAVCRDTDGSIKGYCVYYRLHDTVEVSEILYLDAITIHKLLKYAISDYEYVQLEVSNHERIEKVFKRAIPRTNSCVMMRVNQYALFEKLFDTKVKSSEDVLRILKKPVLINEKF